MLKRRMESVTEEKWSLPMSNWQVPCLHTSFAPKPCLIHVRWLFGPTGCSTSYWGHRTLCISSQVEVRTGRGQLPRNVQSGANWEEDSATSRKSKVSRSSSCHVSIANVDECHLNLTRFGEDLGIGRNSQTTRLERLFTAKEPCYVFTFHYRSKGWFHFPENRKAISLTVIGRDFGGPGDYASISFSIPHA